MRKICATILGMMLGCLLGATPVAATTTVSGATSASVPGTILLKNIEIKG